MPQSPNGNIAVIHTIEEIYMVEKKCKRGNEIPITMNYSYEVTSVGSQKVKEKWPQQCTDF